MKKWYLLVVVLVVLGLAFFFIRNDEKLLTLEIENSSLVGSSVTYLDGYKTVLNMKLNSSAKVKYFNNFKCDFDYSSESDVVLVDELGNIMPQKVGSTKVFAFCKKNNIFSNYVEVVVE